MVRYHGIVSGLPPAMPQYTFFPAGIALAPENLRSELTEANRLFI